MNKTWLIIKREYLSRVRKKTFILSTILTPLFFVGLIVAVTWISVSNVDKEKIAVVDNSGIFRNNLESDDPVTFEFPTGVDTSNYLRKGYTAILVTPADTSLNYSLYSKKQLGLVAFKQVENQVNKAIENHLINQRFNIDVKRIDSVRSEAGTASLKNYYGENESVKEGNREVASFIGYISAFLIYITLFIYGSMVMRGVMEEKTNRIAEVVISSVRPFQLMMGKIVGIGMVGLTQFLIWIVLIFALSTAAGALLSPETLQQAGEASKQLQSAQMKDAGAAAAGFAELKITLVNVNIPLIVACFVFYFIGGYLFYAALFAAVGSAVNEDIQEAQSLMLPIIMPIIVAIIIMINAITAPSSSLATWSSVIPFFSPIVMMARIPFGVPDTVPYWQLFLSMSLLVLGFLFTTWLAGKIYRTGILMYGKKPSWKEMWKWTLRTA
ncbi:MAG TPA: ABC transporter permease [Chitinophagaceae bacterium]